MIHGTVFGSGTGMRLGLTGTEPCARTESQKGSVAATLLCLMTRNMLSAMPAQQAARRKRLLFVLMKVRGSELAHCIDQMLRVFVSEGGPHALDAAIDTLSQTGINIVDYAWNYLKSDIAHWGPTSERAYEPNDDYWYILLRAVARSDASEIDRMRIVLCCANATCRGIREAVVESLRDIGGPVALARLQKFAAKNADPFICKIAREALDDMET